MDGLIALIGLIAIFLLWILPMIVAYKLCLARHRNPAAGIIFALFFGWIAVLIMWLVFPEPLKEKSAQEIQSKGFFGFGAVAIKDMQTSAEKVQVHPQKKQESGFCFECGRKLKINWKFCTSCGSQTH